MHYESQEHYDACMGAEAEAEMEARAAEAEYEAEMAMQAERRNEAIRQARFIDEQIAQLESKIHELRERQDYILSNP